MRQRVTVYSQGMFGILKVEGSDCNWETTAIAQHEGAVVVSLLPKGHRKKKRIEETTFPSIVILAGWGHPDFPRADSFLLSDPDGSVARDFSKFIDEHIKVSGAVVLADFREHDFKGK